MKSSVRAQFFHAPTKDGKRFSIELPAYAEEALNLLGIASDRVRMITSPLGSGQFMLLSRAGSWVK